MRCAKKAGKICEFLLSGEEEQERSETNEPATRDSAPGGAKLVKFGKTGTVQWEEFELIFVEKVGERLIGNIENIFFFQFQFVCKH